MQLLAGLAKVVVGRLRPNFHATCVPSPGWEQQCGNWSHPALVTDFTCQVRETVKSVHCTGLQGSAELFPDPDERARYTHEARLSFPSGHSALACYGMVWLVTWLSTRRTSQAWTLPAQTLQVPITIFLASVTGSKRAGLTQLSALSPAHLLPTAQLHHNNHSIHSAPRFQSVLHQTSSNVVVCGTIIAAVPLRRLSGVFAPTAASSNVITSYTSFIRPSRAGRSEHNGTTPCWRGTAVVWVNWRDM